MKEYWFCIVGPVERDELPDGADFPLRLAVMESLMEMLGEDIEIRHQLTGWGVTEEQKEKMLRAAHE